MKYRSLPTTILLSLFAVASSAQTPQSVQYKAPLFPADGQRITCNDAGTVSLSLAGNAQSMSTMFLCFGDELVITHNGDAELSGDPNPATTPGIGYAFYSCAPTVSGPTLSDILLDACILDEPTPPQGLWITTGNNPNGNTTFANTGFLQRFFNNGDPVEIWFAPITVDDFFTNGYEEAAPGAGAGPCVNVNVDAAFRVVYLNEIRIEDLDVTPFGVAPGTGSFQITGGLPQFDGSNYSIQIYQRTNPSITGSITSGPATHGSMVTFEVPNDRQFVIEVTDNTGCSNTFFVTVPSIVMDIDCIEIAEGSTGCVDVRVRNFTDVQSLQLFFYWNRDVISFLSISSPGLPDFNPAASTNLLGDSLLLISYFNAFLAGVSIPYDEVLFTLCFEAIGQPGECTFIDLKDGPAGLRLEAIISLNGGSDDAQIGISSLNGCVCIRESGDLQVNLTPTPPTCANLNNGQLRIEVSGGIEPYDYQWAHATNPALQGSGVLAFNPSSVLLPNLPPGIYSVTVTDNDTPPNQVVRQVQIVSPPPIQILFDGFNPTCHNDVDGGVLANVLGGTGTYTYAWSTGLSGPDEDVLSDVPNGTYALTITDQNGCTAVEDIVLQTTPIVINEQSKTNISCGGPGNNGSVTVLATGGTINPGSGYIYTWLPNVGSGPTITGLGPGTYNLTVSDDNGCTATFSTTFTDSDGPTIDGFNVTDAGCADKANGSIEALVTPASGATNLQFNWSGPNSTTFTGQTITGLLPGNYFVTVTDDNGCTATGVTFVSNVFPFFIADTFRTRPTCPGGSNGSIGLLVNGGTMPYSFTWSNVGVPSANSVNSPIPAGTYTVTVTDAEGCGPMIVEVILQDPAGIQASFGSIDPVSCAQGMCDGAAQLSAAYSDGTTGNFNFTWSSGEIALLVTSSTATQLCGGMQSVTISDGSCATVTEFEVPGPAPIEVVPVITQVSCQGAGDGEVLLIVNGGTAPFQYAWSAGDTVTLNSRNNLQPGAYQVTVIDQNGCIGFSPVVTIMQPDLFQLNLVPGQTSDVRCAGDANGVIAVSTQGGNPGTPSFLWSGSVSTGAVASGLAVGTYSVTATDSRGCTAILEHSIQSPPAVVVSLLPLEEPDCHGESTFLTAQSASGGNGPNFTWSVDNSLPRPITNPFAVFADRDILVTVFDALGCRWDTIVSVGQPAPLFLDLGPDIEIELGDSITLGPVNSLDGFDIISYLWNPATGLDCSTCPHISAKPDITTTYTLRIEDENGCAAEDKITVDVRTIRRVYIPNAISANYDGFNDVFTVYTGRGVRQVDYIRIFDRWGNQVYELINPPPSQDGSVPGWDGHFRGRLMDPGVYVYAVQVTFLDNRSLIYRGDVNLIR
jgi:gliding motility-associated-like protein